jgi:hypothetical protein
MKRRFTLTLSATGRLVRRCLRLLPCNVRGCRNAGNPCWLPDDHGKPSEHYCYNHMREQGYCPGCGLFWAGIESFDFSRTGLCENCASDAGIDDDDWDDDWDDDLMEWDDYPHVWPSVAV